MMAVGEKDKSFSLFDFPGISVLANREDSLADDNEIEYAEAISFNMGVPYPVIGMTAVHEVGDGGRDKVKNG
ncbi:hypothetical protein D3C76_1485410 [compost metagenome]